MNDKKPRKRFSADAGAPAQQGLYPFPDKRNGARYFGPHRRRPVSQMVPGQKITGKTKNERKDKKKNPYNPGHFSRFLERTGDKSAQHMQKDDDNHQISAPGVNLPVKPAHIGLGRDEFNTRKGLVDRRAVINKKEDPRQNL